MQVTHDTVDSGDLSYTTVTINVGWCVITHVDPPGAPTTEDASYIVFDVEKTITLTPQFEQVPACGYALVEDIQWTIPTTAPITETADPYVLTVVSTDGLSHHADNPVIVQNFVTYEEQAWEPSLSFTVYITDPCRASTITPVTVSAMTVVLGEEELQAFTEAVDTAGASYGSTVCGTRLYEILEFSTSVVSEVATVEDLGGGDYQIRAYSENEDHEGTHPLKLRVTFVDYPLTDSTDYPVAETAFTLTIQQATCDCSLITWDEPA